MHLLLFVHSSLKGPPPPPLILLLFLSFSLLKCSAFFPPPLIHLLLLHYLHPIIPISLFSHHPVFNSTSLSFWLPHSPFFFFFFLYSLSPELGILFIIAFLPCILFNAFSVWGECNVQWFKDAFIFFLSSYCPLQCSFSSKGKRKGGWDACGTGPVHVSTIATYYMLPYIPVWFAFSSNCGIALRAHSTSLISSTAIPAIPGTVLSVELLLGCLLWPFMDHHTVQCDKTSSCDHSEVINNGPCTAASQFVKRHSICLLNLQKMVSLNGEMDGSFFMGCQPWSTVSCGKRYRRV